MRVRHRRPAGVSTPGRSVDDDVDDRDVAGVGDLEGPGDLVTDRDIRARRIVRVLPFNDFFTCPDRTEPK